MGTKFIYVRWSEGVSLCVLVFISFICSSMCSIGCRKPYIDILVSPVVENNVSNELVLIWKLETVLPDGWIVLKNGSNELFRAPVNNLSGSVESKIFYEAPSSYSFTKQDLGYNVEYKQGVTGAVIAAARMETNPTWMSDEGTKLGDLPISKMFIPGTHDSGAYTGRVTHAEKRIEKYVMAQDETALNQLIFGIRSLDLRVSYYSLRNQNYNELYINHGIQKVQPLSNVIQDVKAFLENTREVLILDFHGFPIGFNRLKLPHLKAHETLIDYLIKELHAFIAPPNLTWDAKLSDFWKLNKTLILAYNNKGMVAKYGHVLWPPVDQKWGNVQEVSKLKTFLSKVFSSPPSGPWSAQAELTATGRKIISDQLKGLRLMAASINSHVTEWFQGDWGQKSNIVSCDFFRNTGIVKTAIAWNLRRAKGDTCDV